MCSPRKPTSPRSSTDSSNSHSPSGQKTWTPGSPRSVRARSAAERRLDMPLVPGSARPRRLRSTPALRRLVSEVQLHPSELILPMFVKEGLSEPVPLEGMPGVVQHTLESLLAAAEEAVAAGVGGLMLFGIPEHKDETGSQADDPDGILNRALSLLSDRLRSEERRVGKECGARRGSGDGKSKR